MATDKQMGYLSSAINAPAPAMGDLQIDVSTINAVRPEGMNDYQRQIYDQMDRYNSAIPVQAHSTYFPSDQPIQKGTYSGSIVGSVPIFAPSRLTPYGVFDARQQALQNAAAAKAKEIDDFYAKFGKSPETDRKAVQDQLDEGYYNWLGSWVAIGKERYGKNFAKMLQSDTQFLKEQQSWNTVAQYNSQLVEETARINADIKTGNFIASPELMESMNYVMAGIDGLQQPGNAKSADLSNNVLKMSTYYDLDKAVNESLDGLIQDVYQTHPGATPNGIYDILTSTTTTETDDSKLRERAKLLKSTRYAGAENITEDMIYNSMRTKIGKKVERKFETQANQFDNSGGAFDIYSDADVEESAEINVTSAGTGSGADRVAGVTGYDGYTFKKPIKTVTSQGETMFDFATGKMVTAEGSQEIVWGEARNLPVNQNGSVITNDQLGENMYYGQNPNSYSYQPMVVGQYTVPAVYSPDGLTVIQPEKVVTVAKPAVELKNAITRTDKSGKIISGVPVDKMQKAADKRNQSKPKPAVKPAAAPKASQGKIRVKRNSDGATGTIDASDFDPNIYTKI